MKPLVDKKEIRLAMLGKVEGNGHPYSWSAMFNGYDPDEMEACPYAHPMISEYLDKQPKDILQIPGARVTHVWTDDPKYSESIAKCSLIPNIVKKAEDVIGQVDAVIVPTDKGFEHVERCRPFVEAGIPVFVDKPLVDNAADLAIFSNWVKEGRPIMSSSCMRYAKEFEPYRTSCYDLGELRFVNITTPLTWEKYGIHALEGMYSVIGPGFISARNTGTIDRNVVHLKHKKGIDVVVIASQEMTYHAMGLMVLIGTSNYAQVAMKDTFYAFQSQLKAFVQYLREGERPFPFAETEELMKLVIAGIMSREEGGREVLLSEIQ